MRPGLDPVNTLTAATLSSRWHSASRRVLFTAEILAFEIVIKETEPGRMNVSSWLPPWLTTISSSRCGCDNPHPPEGKRIEKAAGSSHAPAWNFPFRPRRCGPSRWIFHCLWSATLLAGGTQYHFWAVNAIFAPPATCVLETKSQVVKLLKCSIPLAGTQRHDRLKINGPEECGWDPNCNTPGI